MLSLRPLLSLWLVFALGLSASLPARALDESDLLPVDQAFALSAKAQAPDRIAVQWRIANGYYLYRHRMSVRALDADVRISALELPAGKPHRDPFFGDVETYRGAVAGVVRAVAIQQPRLRLQINYQGCAEAGICYPPQTRVVTVILPAAVPPPADQSDGLSGLSRSLRIGAGPPPPLLGASTNAPPLPEAQAFQVDAIADGGDAVLLRLTPTKGYYLYRDKISWALDAGKGIAAPRPPLAAWPKGVPFKDDHFGNVVVYFDQIQLRVPLRRTHLQAVDARLNVHLQGCQTGGICYPPLQRELSVKLPASSAGTASAAIAVSVPAPDVTPSSPVGAATSTALIPQQPVEARSVSSEASASARASIPSAMANPIPTMAAPPLAERPSAVATRGWLTSFVLALLGGLLLNLMPCVLPVLSLKALSLANSGEGSTHARRHALWYTAGVLISMLVLGGLVLGLRSTGLALGWGFQLQQPLVVAVLGLVIFALGLNLSGLWHAGGGWTGLGDGLTRRSGPSGDLFTGVLAVVVATPCTAPFMGAALAYAFSAPPMAGMSVFLALGLGLALPFLMIGFVPALAKRLPRPGAWMETLKQFLAFPMYLTAIWLAWVLARQRGADAVGLWMLAATTVALAAWAWNRSRQSRAPWALGIAILSALASAVPLSLIHRLPRPNAIAPQAVGSTSALPIVAFSEQRLADLRAAHRPILVNITADWCVTCKANERAVFSRQGFAEVLAAANAVYMVGDYTDVDPAITAFLQRHHAVGVPLYLVYPSNRGAPRALPTVLTSETVRRALAQAAQ